MKRLLWLVAAVVLAVVVAIQVGTADEPAAVADGVDGAVVPTVAPGTDILAGVAVIARRVRDPNYRRAAFGEAWTDDNPAPEGHNGCDTRFLRGFDVLGETLREASSTLGTSRWPG